MNIKLEQYKIFNEAASTLSFSLAARNLFISQSAVSQAIHTLEKELEELTIAGCWVHCRRRFDEALKLISKPSQNAKK